jgi:hypothetical protein
MMNVGKRILQRFLSSGNLPYRQISQKLYCREPDILKFINEHVRQGYKQETAVTPH